jgi:hypothetical protein
LFTGKTVSDFPITEACRKHYFKILVAHEDQVYRSELILNQLLIKNLSRWYRESGKVFAFLQ